MQQKIDVVNREVRGKLITNVDFIEFPLNDCHWYGLGAIRTQRLPLEKLSIPRSPLITADPITPGMEHSSFLGVLEPFWFNSRGFGVYVKSDTKIEFSFNAPLSSAENKVVLAAGLETDGKLKIFGTDMQIIIFQCRDAKQVVEEFYKLINFPEPPSLELFEKPLWSTWAAFKNEIDEGKIISFAEEIKKHEFPAGILGIDAKWQKHFGDSRLDPEKFPDPAELVEKIHRLGFEVTLWNIPFVTTASENYQNAVQAGVILRDRSDGTPYIGRWWEGEAAFLNLCDPEALDWHIHNLTELAQSIKVDGFKFDAGEAGFYIDKSIDGTITVLPQLASQNYIKKVAAAFPWSDTRSAWRSQEEAVLVRHWDKASHWGFRNGLASCITQAITLNLLGYRYSFPDMIGGNDYSAHSISKELLIRWTQAVAPMPFIQFSVPPWKFGEDCSEICLKYARLHCQLAKYNFETASSGSPIVRPLWWGAVNDENALSCEDQYLLGDRFLVAPVIEEGVMSRYVYLPSGNWRSYWDKGESYRGPLWLGNYAAPLDKLPLFIRTDGLNAYDTDY